MEVPVFIINGFLESGKTTFIKTTLEDPEFSNGEKILIILCEEGEEEFKIAHLKKVNADLVIIDEQEKLTPEFLERCKSFYRPQKVVIEMNGMWNLEDFLEFELPDLWVPAQIITTVDASTFRTYLENMRKIMMEQLKFSDTILFNRYDRSLKKTELRRTVKLVNRQAQIIYESSEGIDTEAEEEDLPFDIHADLIEIEDDDFGIWYMDAMEFPDKYNGKRVHFKGMVYKDRRMPKDSFVPGRFAMTCCADDIAFIGFFCKPGQKLKNMYQMMENHCFVYVTAKINLEFLKEYQGKGPVLYAEDLQFAGNPEEDVVYFT